MQRERSWSLNACTYSINDGTFMTSLKPFTSSDSLSWTNTTNCSLTLTLTPNPTSSVPRVRVRVKDKQRNQDPPWHKNGLNSTWDPFLQDVTASCFTTRSEFPWSKLLSCHMSRTFSGSNTTRFVTLSYCCLLVCWSTGCLHELQDGQLSISVSRVMGYSQDL